MLFCVLSHQSFGFFVTRWAVARQTPLSMGFFRQEYWNRLPFPSPGDPHYPRIGPLSTYISCIGRQVFFFLTTSATRKFPKNTILMISLTKEMKVLYPEDGKLLLKWIKESASQWKDIPCSSAGIFNIATVSILPIHYNLCQKTIYLFNFPKTICKKIFFSTVWSWHPYWRSFII